MRGMVRGLGPQAAAGAIFLVVGIAAAVLSRGYAMGTATRMGPGFFPFVLAMLVAILGAGAVLQAVLRRDGTAMPRWEGLDVFFLLLGVVLFGLLIERAGLVVAVAALVICSCYRRLARRPVEVVLLCACLAGLTGAVFIEAFALPFAWF